MEPEIPPASPPPSPDPNVEGPHVAPRPAGEPVPPSPAPPPPPPIEVRAEPVGPGERGRVVDAPPSSSAANGGASHASSGGAGSTVPPGGGAGASAIPARNHAWAMACHAAALIDFGVTSVPGLIASLVVWLIKKDEDPEVDFHGKEAINFQLNLLVLWVVGLLLLPCFGFGALVWAALAIAKLVLMLIASVRAAEGRRWTYPWIYRVLR
jgi:uncharacterized Tic20 family protein